MSPLFSYQDSYAYLWSDKVYPELMAAIKNNEEEAVILPLYEQFISSDAKASDKSRLEYHMVRYYMDRNDKEKAEEHLENEEKLLSLIEEDSSEMEKDIAALDAASARYYVIRKISAGLDSSNRTKELYKKYQEEYYVALQEAFRRLNTPPIAGGSSRKALQLFEDILQEVDGMNDFDRYSLYSGLGMASFEREKYEDARSYFDKAMEIYKPDNAMEDYLKDLKRK